MNFSKRLKKLRKNSNLTQKELANKVGVSRATIAGYETKGKEPPYSTLQKLSEVLGCSTDYLLGNTDERSPADKIKSALSDDPELLEFWDELKDREDLQMMFKQTRDLPPETIQQIIQIIKTFEKEQDEKYNG